MSFEFILNNFFSRRCGFSFVHIATKYTPFLYKIISDCGQKKLHSTRFFCNVEESEPKSIRLIELENLLAYFCYATTFSSGSVLWRCRRCGTTGDRSPADLRLMEHLFVVSAAVCETHTQKSFRFNKEFHQFTRHLVSQYLVLDFIIRKWLPI